MDSEGVRREVIWRGETAQSRFAYNSTIAPPLPRNQEPGHVPVFFVPVSFLFDVRFIADAAHYAKLGEYGR